MGVSRYDKNADQLCQIINHLRQNQHFSHDRAEMWRVNALVMLEAVLELNHELGKMTDKGWIVGQNIVL